MKPSQVTYSIRRILWSHASPVKQEADSRHLLSLSLAEGIHQLLQLGRPLDLKKDLVIVIRDLNIKVLAGTGEVAGLLVGHGFVIADKRAGECRVKELFLRNGTRYQACERPIV